MEKSSPVVAFEQGELDCKPIYLGFCGKESSYWFYALKQGVPRFLKYVSYFHWDRGPQEVLSMKPLPLEVESELKQFLEGVLGYEFKKRRKNSRDSEAFRVFRSPGDISQDLQDKKPKRPARTQGIQSDSARGGSNEVVGCPSVDPAPGREISRSPLGPRRESKRRGHAVSVGNAPKGIVPPPDVSIKEVLPVPQPLVPPEPKRRGRPPKKQEVSIVPTIVSSNVVVTEIQEPQHVKRKYTRKPKPDGLELGSVGLLIPQPELVIKKTRGRPRLVKP